MSPWLDLYMYSQSCGRGHYIREYEWPLCGRGRGVVKRRPPSPGSGHVNDLGVYGLLVCVYGLIASRNLTLKVLSLLHTLHTRKLRS